VKTSNIISILSLLFLLIAPASVKSETCYEIGENVKVLAFFEEYSSLDLEMERLTIYRKQTVDFLHVEKWPAWVYAFRLTGISVEDEVGNERIVTEAGYFLVHKRFINKGKCK